MTDRKTGVTGLSEREHAAVQAMLIARYALVITEGKLITAEGETWEANFRPEIDALTAVLHIFDIDTSRLPAPTAKL